MCQNTLPSNTAIFQNFVPIKTGGNDRNRETRRPLIKVQYFLPFWIFKILTRTFYLSRTNPSHIIFKGSSDPSHVIFEIHVGQRRIRRRTTLNLSLEIKFKSRSMSDTPLSDIDFKNKLVWTTLKLKLINPGKKVFWIRFLLDGDLEPMFQNTLAIQYSGFEYLMTV